MYLFLSPHFDDAVLSCGGTIHTLTAAGQPVTVLTVMGGVPTTRPDTPIVRDLHRRWGAGEDPAAIRAREDEAAIAALGAHPLHLTDWTDCIYRLAPDGRPLYPDEDALFAEVDPADPARALLATPLPLDQPVAALYAPLGVGHHVDHQLVREWAITLGKHNPALALRFYPEYPYTQNASALQPALDYFQDHALPLVTEKTMLTGTHVAAKVKAIAHYRSQISTFWSSDEAMEKAVRRSLLADGEDRPVERYWHLAERDQHRRSG